jgi:hypothetical protein
MLLDSVTVREIAMETDLLVLSNDAHNFDCYPDFESLCLPSFSLPLPISLRSSCCLS